jgi:hypothetical protein
MGRAESEEGRQATLHQEWLFAQEYKVEYMILLAHTSLKVKNTSFIYNIPSCSVPCNDRTGW